jgi:cell division transport system permease protein
MKLTVREAMLSFRRAPLLSALAVTTIGFALFVLGLFGLVALNLRDTLEDVAERVEVVLYLARGTPVDVVTVAIGDIVAFPEVETVTPGLRDTEHVRAVAERVRGFRFAEDTRYGGDWIEKLDRLRGIAAAVGFVIGAAFAAAAVIIIGTTIRMTVLARNREIHIMRLVGATDGFIRRPFLLDGAFKGALGGLLAITLDYAAYLAVSRALFSATFYSAIQMLLFVLFGMLLGFLASAASVNRHLPPV